MYFDTDRLIKDVTEDKNMEYNWAEDDRTIYEKTWVNQQGGELYIEDATKILSPTEQTNLSDFDEERYRVLEQERFRPEASLQETFQELDDALEYVEENYSVHL